MPLCIRRYEMVWIGLNDRMPGEIVPRNAIGDSLAGSVPGSIQSDALKARNASRYACRGAEPRFLL